MDAIEEIDPLSATMTVQAGAPLETVQQAAARAGLLFRWTWARAAVARWAAISRPTQAATA